MKKFLLASVFASASATVLMLAGFSIATAPQVLAQSTPSSSDSITIKDPAEFNAYQNATTQTTPQAKASASESFLTQFPQSSVKKAVLDGLVDAYTDSHYQPSDPAKIIDAAQRLLQIDPNNLKAMYWIAAMKQRQAASTPAQASQLLDDAAAMATKGLAATKPADVKQADFEKQEAAIDPIFYSILSSDMLYSKKDMPGAVAALRTELEYLAKNNPDATKVPPALNDTFFLGQTYGMLTPPDMVNAVWFLARAENFAPNPTAKAGIDKLARYWYKRYHGKEDGFEAVVTQAATSIFPPPDFKIAPAPTPKDVADKFVADNPDFASYALGDTEYVLSNASTENAEKVWATVKDKVMQIPGRVIAATPNQIQLAVSEDAKTDKKADFTVNMKAPLADKDVPAVGSDETNIVGTYDSYTQNPVQIILRDGEIQKTPKAPVHKPTAAHKKAAS